MSSFTIRPYTPADEAATIALWQRTWQRAYPAIDFAARLEWWRERWRAELVPKATIVVAEMDGIVVGFVTVDASGYLDQIVVAPEAWGRGVAEALLDRARALAPQGLALHVNIDNHRAVRFYRKHGFAVAGEDVNPRSGARIYEMRWRP